MWKNVTHPFHSINITIITDLQVFRFWMIENDPFSSITVRPDRLGFVMHLSPNLKMSHGLFFKFPEH
jgi:hypothetical protein